MDYTVIIEKEKTGGFIASVVELPGCYSQADTMEDLFNNIKEAIQLYVETEQPEGLTEFVGLQKVSV